MERRSSLPATIPTLQDSLPLAAGVARWCAWLTGFFTLAAVATGLLVSALFWLLPSAHAAEPVIYSVYQRIDLGDGSPASAYKDYYVNMGTAQGIKNGSLLQVSRRLATYDLLSEKLFKEVTFPVGTLRVIHADSGVAIARLEKILPADKTPAFSPRALMVGDLVRKSD